MKISVLMSVYNADKYLTEAMDSILAQTYPDFEMIVVNDKSTDKSGDILKAFAQKDPRIVILENAQNLGLTRSLNRGLAIAKGEYVARMDADDISAPDRFQKQVAFLDMHPDYR